MKKSYNAPIIEVVNVEDSNMICASASFGEGTTNTMNAPQVDFDDVIDNLGEFDNNGNLSFGWE